MLKKNIALAAALVSVHALAAAQSTPVGLWKTVDDDTKKEKSLVRIAESGGVLTGRIEKLLDPTVAPDAVCDKCSDDRRDKPIVGLTILRDLRHNASDAALWDGGDVLDPKNGKVYRARLKPVDEGRKLEMRGYVGPFYRTQVWIRVE